MKWTKLTILLLFLMTVLFFFLEVDYVKEDSLSHEESLLSSLSSSHNEKTETSDIKEKQNETEDRATKEYKSFNVLFLGIDDRQNDISRADVLMLAHIDPDVKKVNVVSIPRDTRVEIEGIGKTKINHAFMIGEENDKKKGTELTIRTVSKLFADIEIDYFVQTDFQGFKQLVDVIGGIDIELDEPVQLTGSEIIFPAEEQHLNGEMALRLARERYSLADGDFGRQKHQVIIIKAIVKKMLNGDHIKMLPSLLKELQNGMIDTNLPTTDIIGLAWQFHGFSLDNLVYMQLEGKSATGLDPLLNQELYYWIPNEKALKKISEQFITER